MTVAHGHKLGKNLPRFRPTILKVACCRACKPIAEFKSLNERLLC